MDYGKLNLSAIFQCYHLFIARSLRLFKKCVIKGEVKKKIVILVIEAFLPEFMGQNTVTPWYQRIFQHLSTALNPKDAKISGYLSPLH